jgi:hypothetical protein
MRASIWMSLGFAIGCQGAAPGGGTASPPPQQTSATPPTASLAPGPTGTSTPPTTQPVCTPTPTPPGPVTWDGPLSEIAPVTTFVNGAASKYGELLAADFNGDGIGDIAVQTTAGVEVWFGPVPAGEVELGTASVHILIPVTTPRSTLTAAGDLDGDGTAEIGIGPWFSEVPSSGDVSADAAPVATILPDIHYGKVVDVDGDAVMDLVSARYESVAVAYGPIAGEIALPDGLEAAPSAETATLRAPESCEWSHPFAILPDVNGSGAPELLVLGHNPYDGCMGVGERFVWELGDLRGQIRTTADVISNGYEDVSPFPDVDGDGVQEFAYLSRMYHAADLVTLGSAAVPFASLSGTGSIFVPLIDLNADGCSEVIAISESRARIVDGAQVLGTIDPAVAGYAYDQPYGAHIALDVTGDGVLDVIDTGGTIVSGADLVEGWALATAN